MRLEQTLRRTKKLTIRKNSQGGWLVKTGSQSVGYLIKMLATIEQHQFQSAVRIQVHQRRMTAFWGRGQSHVVVQMLLGFAAWMFHIATSLRHGPFHRALLCFREFKWQNWLKRHCACVSHDLHILKVKVSTNSLVTSEAVQLETSTSGSAT